MKELEKKIDEAAKEFAIKAHTKPGTETALNAEYWWRYGALSPEAKEYWQQGMYNESQIRNLFITHMFSWNNCDSDEMVDAIINAWKTEQNKKKK